MRITEFGMINQLVGKEVSIKFSDEEKEISGVIHEVIPGKKEKFVDCLGEPFVVTSDYVFIYDRPVERITVCGIYEDSFDVPEPDAMIDYYIEYIDVPGC